MREKNILCTSKKNSVGQWDASSEDRKSLGKQGPVGWGRIKWSATIIITKQIILFIL